MITHALMKIAKGTLKEKKTITPNHF